MSSGHAAELHVVLLVQIADLAFRATELASCSMSGH
jgi:hypothetical protein